MPKLATQVYKVHGTYYFFPASEMWTQIPSLTVKLIFALGPQLKGTFNCIETIETRTTYPIPQKTGPKRPKVNVNPRFISPIRTWAQITPPPSLGIANVIIMGVETSLYLSNQRYPGPPYEYKQFIDFFRQLTMNL